MRYHLTFNQVAQGLHVTLGALFLFVPVAMKWPHPIGIGTLSGLCYAVVKEGLYDPVFEDSETRGSGWVDFSFYLVGMGLARLMLL